PAPLPVPRPRLEPAVPAAARAYAAVPSTTPIAPPRPIAASAGGQPLQLSGMRPVAATTTPSAMRWSIGAPAADGKVLRPPANVDVTSSIAKLAEPEPAPRAEEAEPESRKIQEKIQARLPEPAPPARIESASQSARASEPRPADRPAEKVASASKWVIQLGATDDESKARDILARARAKASVSLADASPFTEKVEKGGTTLFRARFAGFEGPKDAEKTCAQLKRGGFACFATRG
ncbi:SPOR domain-containing protein, partial [Bosea sp. (in: a-proteobacteria)]|uniref:SPOR domain-containing protein n=1 Tax=Bosea sp. (in: a-proteobacteria) TaxID=1871050 RepID=UPI002FCBA319